MSVKTSNKSFALILSLCIPTTDLNSAHISLKSSGISAFPLIPLLLSSLYCLSIYLSIYLSICLSVCVIIIIIIIIIIVVVLVVFFLDQLPDPEPLSTPAASAESDVLCVVVGHFKLVSHYLCLLFVRHLIPRLMESFSL